MANGGEIVNKRSKIVVKRGKRINKRSQIVAKRSKRM